MTIWCVAFAVACFLVVVYVDEFHDYCNPWFAMAGVFAGILGAVVGGA
jgi:hypothetical protein